MCERTCAKHRATFGEILEEAGLRGNPVIAKLVQRSFVVAVISAYPLGYMIHTRDNSCLGCHLENDGPLCGRWAVATLRRLVSLAALEASSATGLLSAASASLGGGVSLLGR